MDAQKRSYKDVLQVLTLTPQKSTPATKIGNGAPKTKQPIPSPYKNALLGLHTPSIQSPKSAPDTSRYKEMLMFIYPGAEIKIVNPSKIGMNSIVQRIISVDYFQYYSQPTLKIILEGSLEKFYVSELDNVWYISTNRGMYLHDSDCISRVFNKSLPILAIRDVFNAFEKINSPNYRFEQFMAFTQKSFESLNKYYSEQDFLNDFNQRVKDFEFFLTDVKEKWIRKKFDGLKKHRQCDCRKKIRTVEDFYEAFRNGPDKSIIMVDEKDKHCCDPQALLRVVLNAIRDDLPLIEVDGSLYGLSLPRNCPHIFCIEPHSISMYNPGVYSEDFAGGGRLKNPLARLLFWHMLIGAKPEYEELFEKKFCQLLIQDCWLKGYVSDTCTSIYEVIEQFDISSMDIEDDILFMVLFGILRNGINGDLNRGSSFVMYGEHRIKVEIRESDIDVWIDSEYICDYGCWVRSTIRAFATAIYPRLNVD